MTSPSVTLTQKSLSVPTPGATGGFSKQPKMVLFHEDLGPLIFDEKDKDLTEQLRDFLNKLNLEQQEVMYRKLRVSNPVPEFKSRRAA